MTDQSTNVKVTITLDAANSDRQFPAYQLSINAMRSETSGHGFRLLGPKYVGRSRNLRTVELSQRDADEIRAILDEAFPRKAVEERRVLTLGEYDAAWHAVEGSAGEEGADPGTVLRAVLDRLGIGTPGPIVAYRNPDRPSVLLCRGHGRGWGLTPLTSDDLPDGGLCTYGDPADPSDVCGRDVLIDSPKSGSGL